MMGAAALQRFLVPVQIPPQNSGQENAIPDPPSDDNEIFEVEIPAIQLDNTSCNIRAIVPIKSAMDRWFDWKNAGLWEFCCGAQFKENSKKYARKLLYSLLYCKKSN